MRTSLFDNLQAPLRVYTAPSKFFTEYRNTENRWAVTLSIQGLSPMGGKAVIP